MLNSRRRASLLSACHASWVRVGPPRVGPTMLLVEWKAMPRYLYQSVTGGDGLA